MTNPPQRILIRGLNWLGDAIMGTAALQRLRQAHPNAQIVMLTPEKLASLWANQPFVDEIIPFPREQSVLQTSAVLRARQFDAAIAFPNSFRSALELWLARIPMRIGYAHPWRGWLFTHPVPPRCNAVKMHKRSSAEIQNLIANSKTDEAIPTSAHHIHDYLNLTAALGALPEPIPPRIVVTENEIAETRQQFEIEETGAPWFGLNPGAEYGPAKRWPVEHFVTVALELHRRTGCRWLLFGGPGDKETCKEITAKICGPMEARNLAGQTSLRELAAGLKLCRLLITNDTGPMHLAAAVGTPMVIPFGSTSPELTGPAFSPNAQILKSNLPCSPCFRRDCPIGLRCLNGITPETVVEAAVKLVS